MAIDPTRFISHDEAGKIMLTTPEARAEYERLGPRFNLINRITAGRLAKGWTQADLAQAIGTKRPAISRLESGEVDPRWSTVVAVCRALELPISVGEDQRLVS